MSAKVLTIDIETQRAVVEVWGLFKQFVPIDRILVPSRILCFAATWRGNDRPIFRAAWDDDDEDAYVDMIRSAWELLNEADIVVGWNSARFDEQWLQSEFVRLDLGRPTPYKTVDLIQVLKRNFRQGLLSMKLDWSARTLLGDRKTPHGGSDLWSDIRYGSRQEQRAAQKLMKEYNIQDTVLTAQIFERYLPWITALNLALYEKNGDGELHCTKCNSTNLKKDGIKAYVTMAGVYQMHRCLDCDATSRGHRTMATTTDLRPV